MLLQTAHAPTAHSTLLPHGFCYLWQPGLLWTHFWSDLLIGLSYVTISFSLAYLVHKARRDIPFSMAFVAFGLFIVTCGLTHFMEIWTLWQPVYWISGGVKVVTAAASVATAVWMPFLVPRARATITDARLARERELAAARAAVLEEQNARLAASETQLRTMLDAIPTLAWTAQAEGYIDWYNARWYEYTGSTPDDMAGWGWQTVHDPAVLPQVLERWRTSIATGEPFEMTFPLKGADGVFRPFLTRIAPVRDAGGEVVRWFGTNTDLSPERAAAAEREQLATLVDVLPVMVTLRDPALAHTRTGATRFNRAFVDTLGWTQDDVRGSDLMTLCHPDPDVRHRAEAHMQAPRDLRRTPQSGSGRAPDAPQGVQWVELPTRAKDGRMVPVQWTNVLLAGGRQVGVGVDLTERKAAEAAVEAERTLLRAVLDQMPVGVSVAEAPGGRLLFTNAAGERLLGHPAQKPETGSEHAEYGAIHEDGSPYEPGEYPMAQALHGDTVDQHLMRYRRGDGVVTLAVSAGPVYAEDGAIVRAVATWTDVTERMALEDALRRARDVSEAANHAKTEFLARMSHELRTPLNAIQGHVQLVEMGLHGPVTDAQREALGRVARAQEHLLGLIGDILDVSRLERGAVQFAFRAVDLSEVLGELTPIIAPQAAGKKLVLRVQPPTSPTMVWCDRQKLMQVLLNLLGNAIKFTPAGGEVRMDVAPSGALPGMVHVRVADTGIGIRSDQHEAIFQPFVQVQGAYTRDVGGAVLGLAISRDLARGMGGDLRVESQPGVGSTFVLSVRVAPMEADEPLG